MKVGLLGYGRFGAAFADLLQAAGHEMGIHDPFVDVPPGLAAASVAEAVQGSDWIFLAVPVSRMESMLGELRPLLVDGQTVVDVGSVKEPVCASMDAILADAIAHVGSHPLFGPLSLARGDRPLRVVVCASRRHPQAARRACRLFRSLGCEVLEREPGAHDRAMARTHAMAFFIAKALVEMGIGEDLDLAPPSFLGLANMLAAVRGDAGHLFATIQQENAYAAEARSELIEQLRSIHRRLHDAPDGLSIPGPSERA